MVNEVIQSVLVLPVVVDDPGVDSTLDEPGVVAELEPGVVAELEPGVVAELEPGVELTSEQIVTVVL